MILGILQARISSTRLPGKVLLPVMGVPMLLRQWERLMRSKKIDQWVLATSSDPSDDALEAFCQKNGIKCYRGHLQDVLDRFYQAALPYQPDQVVRITGDCPLIDPALIDKIAEFHIEGGFDYSSNTLQTTYPDGLDVEMFRASCLKEAWNKAQLPSQREHVTPYIYQHPEHFRIGQYTGDVDLSHLRWTVDEPEDLQLVTKIYEDLYPVKKDFSTEDVLNYLEKNPGLSLVNSKHGRNASYWRAVAEEPLVGETAAEHALNQRYQKSEQLLKRALRTIPLGTQTFSKSKTQFPLGVSPYYIEKAKGSHVWDVDGNEYIDFINSLASVTLGYNDPDVTAAVQAQLEKGVIFSLPSPLEITVAEKIAEMVPCAEMVRFGKNGSDATAGAIRVARAFTRRDHVAVCGYHGWQDWYIGSTARNLGVPQSTRDLTHTFSYNNLESLEVLFKNLPDQIAAVILEPMNVTEPKDGFLEGVKDLAHKNGALLVFDETITGFRFANGGAQELFGVTPDLATFGKGLANGYPLSAVAGRADVMRLMEEIFFSFTFGGETLSLAAALAAMTKMQKMPVVKTLRGQGAKVVEGIRQRLEKHDVAHFLSVAGNPTWSFLIIKDTANYSQWDIKTLFLQEMFARGILILGTHNMSYAHSDEDVERLLMAYDEVLPVLKDAVDRGAMQMKLRCQTLKPLFKVR